MDKPSEEPWKNENKHSFILKVLKHFFEFPILGDEQLIHHITQVECHFFKL